MTLGLTWLTAYDTPFDPAVHGVDSFGYEVFSGSLAEKEEGDVISPYFTATIENPGIAGLAAAPERYGVYWERGVNDAVAVELARGRLTGLPTDLGATTCELEFLCVPPDEDDVLQAAADALRVGEVDYDPDAAIADREAAEMYDPLFFDANATDDPNTVLVARRQLWRWNRKTLVPELVHLTDGVVEHTIENTLKGTLTFRVLTPPKSITKLRLMVQWTQVAKGPQTFNHIGSFASYSYQDFLSAMPKPGDAIGSDTGWSIAEFSCTDTPSTSTYRVQANSSNYGDAAGGYLNLRAHVISYAWRAAYDYQQARQETIDISMPAACQPVLYDQKTENVATVNLGALNLDLTTPEWQAEDPDTLDVQHYVVGDKVLANDRAWTCVHEHDAQDPFKVHDATDVTLILWQQTTKAAAFDDMRLSGFANSNRGKRSVRHGIRRLDREVCKRARAVEISLTCTWAEAREVTCADTARVAHSKFPGGEAVGKVSSVELRADGHSRTGKITILASIGDGSALPVAADGQEQTGDSVYTASYAAISTPVDAYGLSGQNPFADLITNVKLEQENAANEASFGGLDPMAAIAALPTRYNIAFEPLREEALLRRRVTITCLPVHFPMGIDVRPAT